ncbi:MAG: hypothetical protein QOH27_4614 [Mycobacterium sp.]|nr:hypothetical protein [Mycobacterium sp.]
MAKKPLTSRAKGWVQAFVVITFATRYFRCGFRETHNVSFATGVYIRGTSTWPLWLSRAESAWLHRRMRPSVSSANPNQFVGSSPFSCHEPGLSGCTVV